MSSVRSISGVRWLPFVVVASIGAFLLAPWPFEEKAHAILHGICGQTPGHTDYVAGSALPLDARCVGIYGGLLVTVVILHLSGRARYAKPPTRGSLGVLGVFVVMMAIDGFNSLSTDVGRGQIYAPSNDLRLLTGWATGVAIGTVMTMLVAMTVWAGASESEPILPNWRWPLYLAAPVAVLWIALQTNATLVYYLVGLALIASAVLAFSTLILCSIVMLKNQMNGFGSASQVDRLAAVSIVIGAAVLLGLAAGRFWLERQLPLAS